MNRVLYKKDAIALYNKYYKQNNNNIKDTLSTMEIDGIIPYFFMKYYITYKEFLEKFGIPENIYLELNCPLWIDQDIIRHDKIIKDNRCTKPIAKC